MEKWTNYMEIEISWVIRAYISLAKTLCSILKIVDCKINFLIFFTEKLEIDKIIKLLGWLYLDVVSIDLASSITKGWFNLNQCKTIARGGGILSEQTLKKLGRGALLESWFEKKSRIALSKNTGGCSNFLYIKNIFSNSE